MSTQTTTVDLQQLYALTCTLRRPVFFKENRYSFFGLHEVRVALDIRRQNSYANEFSSRSWCGRSMTHRVVRQKTSYFPIWMLRLCFSKCRPGIPQDGIFYETSYWALLENLSRKSKSHENLIRTTSIPHEGLRTFIVNISLNSTKNEKCFRQKLYITNENTHFNFNKRLPEVVPFLWNSAQKSKKYIVAFPIRLRLRERAHRYT
jgi:hypothetical protein